MFGYSKCIYTNQIAIQIKFSWQIHSKVDSFREKKHTNSQLNKYSNKNAIVEQTTFGSYYMTVS